MSGPICNERREAHLSGAFNLGLRIAQNGTRDEVRKYKRQQQSSQGCT